jgi:hypothetical protein
MSSRTLIYDPETGEWVEEEEYRRRESERRVAERVLRKLEEEYEVELDIDLKTGKARGRVKKKPPTPPT